MPISRVKQRPLAIGRDSEDLAAVRAVEKKGVEAVLALDRIAAVARIPLESVVAGPKEGDVVALLAVDKIIPVTAEEKVDAVAAENGVVAGAAVDRDLDQGSEITRRAEVIVAAIHVEDEIFGRTDVDAERRGIDAVEAHAGAVGGGGELLGPVAAIDLGGVGAGAALDQIGVVARVPDHAVVARLTEDLVVGVATGQRVVVRAAEQKVIAALAEQRIVAGFAKELSAPEPPVSTSLPSPPNRLAAGSAPIGFVERDGVIAVLAEHLDQAGIGDSRGATRNRSRRRR